MKHHRIFVSMSRDYDVVLKAVQDSCAEQFVQEMIQMGSWEFRIDQNKSTRWHCIYIYPETFDVWSDVVKSEQLKDLILWLEDRLEADRLGRNSDDNGEAVSD